MHVLSNYSVDNFMNLYILPNYSVKYCYFLVETKCIHKKGSCYCLLCQIKLLQCCQEVCNAFGILQAATQNRMHNMFGYFSYLILARCGRQVVGGLQNNNRITQQTIGKSVLMLRHFWTLPWISIQYHGYVFNIKKYSKY